MSSRLKAAAYRYPNVDRDIVAALATALDVAPVTARVLAARGFTSADEARAFFSPSLDRDWADPFEIHDMRAGAQAVVTAMKAERHICIFGDYDLDGVSATAVVMRGLRALGCEARDILPSRDQEGYGLTAAAADRIIAEAPSLLITVDCGISAGPQVARLVAAGIEVVVTDHHTPGEDIPQSVPVVNPKLDGPDSPSHDLAGAGVALKLVHAVGVLAGAPDVWRSVVDLATLGTVADVMPLRGENRALVSEGVRKMLDDPNPGIAALAGVARVEPGAISSERISFALAPRLNAAGRVSTPDDALQLLLTDDRATAADYAIRLDVHNKTRQAMEADLSAEVLAQIGESYQGERGIVVAGEGWSDGVKGIVASRVAGRYGVPAILATIGPDGIAVGSARSVGRVNLYEALEAASVHLERFGGHVGAAGLAVHRDNLEAFRQAFIAHLESLPDEQFVAEVIVDAEVELREMTVPVAHEIAQLEPFGASNPQPLFVAHGVEIQGARTVGRDATHLQFSMVQGGVKMAAILFRCPPELIDRTRAANERRETLRADVAFKFELSTYQGRERARTIVSELVILDEALPGDDPFVAELFETAEESFLRRDYGGILDAESFHTKLAGVTFEGRQELIASLEPGDPLEMVREPNNQHDPNATAIWSTRLGAQIGFLNGDLASVIAPAIDAGTPYEVILTDITGGEEGRTRGVNIRVVRGDRELAAEARAAYRADARARLRALPAEQLEAALLERLIGTGTLHDAQRESLRLLEQGRNTLTVMATGRGKSLIFHLFAATQALAHHRASVFIYPLRALVADQAYHLDSTFAELGLNAAVITGETAEGARTEQFAALASGELDIVLTTPEFFHFHGERFAQSARIGFVVVDEAHHVGQARAGNRPSYAQLGAVVDRLAESGGPRPVTLAVTATASPEVAARIESVLGIEERVLDRTVRSNLRIDDRRGSADKHRALLDIAASGEKIVIYVNSREESVKLAKMLRYANPELAPRTAFYNGGLARDVRHEIERRFRSGALRAIVATSAFGEGVNIPDIRHVVLYHLPFSDVEFNQMAGRGGRDGQESTVHLLYGEKDASINEYILGNLAPTRDALGALYRVLAAQSQHGGGQPFQMTNAELAERANRTLPPAPRSGSKSPSGPSAGDSGATAPAIGATRLDESSVSTGIGVFRDLGLLLTEGRSTARRITVAPNPGAGALALASSVRYAEGLEEIEDFSEFRQWAFNASADELLGRFNRPILPE